MLDGTKQTNKKTNKISKARKKIRTLLQRREYVRNEEE